jgi:hypothetical protein
MSELRRRFIEEFTSRCIGVLDKGGVPAFTSYTVPANAPTPIYDEVLGTFRKPRTLILFGERGQVTGIKRPEQVPDSIKAHLGVARAPIPHRPLSYQARARRTDPQTSHQAARSVIKINDTHRRILMILAEGAATDEQLYSAWQFMHCNKDWPRVSQSGVRSRRNELVKKGKVVDSGEKGTTVAGRACTIWRLADQ